MFETLDGIREQKFVSAPYSRIFFGTYALGAALLSVLDFYRHEFHRPAVLSLRILACIVSLICLRNSWMGSRQEKLNKQAILVMILFLLAEFVHDIWYT
jgi:hypothetical protein